MTKIILTTFFVFFLCPLAQAASTTTNSFFNYQAILYDDNGKISEKEFETVEFKIIDGSGKQTYFEVQYDVQVLKGVVNVMIGEGIDSKTNKATGGIALSDLDPKNGPHYLQTRFGNNLPSGKIELGTIPLAAYAQVAQTVVDKAIGKDQIQDKAIHERHLAKELTIKFSRIEGNIPDTKVPKSIARDSVLKAHTQGKTAVHPASSISLSQDTYGFSHTNGLDLQTFAEDLDNALLYETVTRKINWKKLKTNLEGQLLTHTSSTTAHGVTGAAVGTTNVQVLSNKTLTSPIINTPIIKGGTVTSDIAVNDKVKVDGEDVGLLGATIRGDDKECNRLTSKKCFLDGVDLSSHKHTGLTGDAPTLDASVITGNITGKGNLVKWVSPEIKKPKIADFTDSQHSHQDGKGGGTLSGDALQKKVTGSGNVVKDTSPTLLTPTLTSPKVSGGKFSAPTISAPTMTNVTITGGKITGNISVNAGVTIDTVDISVLKTTADSAVSAAAAAQTTANTAMTNAATAQSTANSGVSKANAAQSTANTAVSNAATAQSTANSGVSKANAAQSTANTAVSNAATAQSTANTAVSKANTAQSTANAKVSKSGDTMGNLQVNGSIGVTGTVDGVDVAKLDVRLKILEQKKPTPTIVAWALVKCRGGGNPGQTCPLGGRHNVSKVVIVGDFFVDVYFKTPLQTTDYAASTTIVNSSVGNDASIMHMKKNYVRVDTGTSHDFTVLVIENRLK